MEKMAAMKPKFLRFPGGNYTARHPKDRGHLARIDWDRGHPARIENPNTAKPTNLFSICKHIRQSPPRGDLQKQSRRSRETIVPSPLP